LTAAVIRIRIFGDSWIEVFQGHSARIDDRTQSANGSSTRGDVIDGFSSASTGADGIGEQTWLNRVADGKYIWGTGSAVFVGTHETGVRLDIIGQKIRSGGQTR